MTVIINHKGGVIEAHNAIDFWLLKKNKRLDMLVEGRKERQFILMNLEKEEIESISIDGQTVYNAILESES